jgi:flagellar basal body-associated protein FliL
LGKLRRVVCDASCLIVNIVLTTLRVVLFALFTTTERKSKKKEAHSGVKNADLDAWSVKMETNALNVDKCSNSTSPSQRRV